MPEQDTSESVDYFWELWKRKSFIALFTIAATAAAAVLGPMLPKEYTVRATALVTPPANINYVTKWLAGRNIRANSTVDKTKMVQLNPILLSTYHELTKAPVFVQKIITDLNLKNENGDIASPDSIMPQLESELIRAKNAETAEYSGLLAIEVRGINPERITKIANSWLKMLAEQSKDIRSNEVTVIYKKHVEHSKAIQQKLKAVDDKLEALKSDSHLARSHQLVKVKRSLLYIFQLRHQYILSKLEVNKLELPNVNGSNLSKKKPTNKISDFTRDDVQKLLEQVLAFNSTIKIDPSNDHTSANVKKFDRIISADYGAWGQKRRDILIQASTHIASNEVTPEVERLYRKNIKLLTAELKDVEKIYQEKMMALERLLFKRTGLRKQAELVDLKTEEARVLVSEKTSDVRFISKAIDPSSPTWPNVPKIILLSALGSFFVSAALCLSKGFIDYVEKTNEAIAPPN